MISDELKKRRLPEVLAFEDGRIADSQTLWSQRRNEIIKLLRQEIYGFSPPSPSHVTAVVKESDDGAFAGKAYHSLINLSFDTPKGKFSFPVNIIIPKNTINVPLFLHIAFQSEIPEKYCPAEEIIDGGFALASFYYNDVALDKDDGFVEGIAGRFAGDVRRPHDWGKISMWAWAASRVMDYLQTLDVIDKQRIAVVGHSRLGKTALWCAAQDERFSACISNNSGCSGAALSRGKTGERISDIVNRFGYWFCDNYRKYAGMEASLPFDHHFLLSAIAPRFLYVSSAKEDDWADPVSEFLCCAAASPVYELLGCKGLVAPDGNLRPGTILHEGRIGYHMREGTHFLSRYDWQRFMEYVKNAHAPFKFDKRI